MQWRIHSESTEQVLESGLEHRPVSFREPRVLSPHALPFFQGLFPAQPPHAHLIGPVAGAAGASSQQGVGSTQLKDKMWDGTQKGRTKNGGGGL